MKLRWTIFFLTIIIISRFIRIFHAEIQIEDPNYIYGAFLMTRGLKPFTDFAQVNPPILESIVSFLYRIFGVSYRIPEILTGFSYIATAVIIWKLGSKWFSNLAGALAATVYSLHFLLFRYHLFEREIYATLAVAGAMYLFPDIFSRSKNSVKTIESSSNSFWKAALVSGVIAGVGFGLKQTALIPYSALIIMFCFAYRQFRYSLIAGMGFGITILVINGVYAWIYGEAFIRQTFWFHFIKGSVAPWHIKAYWTLHGLGFAAIISVISIVFLNFKIECKLWLLWSMILLECYFFWFVSGAFWPHYLLSTLLPVSLLAGFVLEKWFSLLIPPHPSVFEKTELNLRLRHRSIYHRTIISMVAALIILVSIFKVNPGILWGSEAAHHYGFSGVSRHRIAACGEFINAHTHPNDRIVAEPFVALLAKRIKVVNFKDNWGLILWMNQMIEQNTYFKSVKSLQDLPFGQIRAQSHHFWMPQIQSAIDQHSVIAIQKNYELPVDDDTLTNWGFSRQFISEYCDIWLLRSGMKQN